MRKLPSSLNNSDCCMLTRINFFVTSTAVHHWNSCQVSVRWFVSAATYIVNSFHNQPIVHLLLSVTLTLLRMTFWLDSWLFIFSSLYFILSTFTIIYSTLLTTIEIFIPFFLLIVNPLV